MKNERNLSQTLAVLKVLLVSTAQLEPHYQGRKASFSMDDH